MRPGKIDRQYLERIMNDLPNFKNMHSLKYLLIHSFKIHLQDEPFYMKLAQ